MKLCFALATIPEIVPTSDSTRGLSLSLSLSLSPVLFPDRLPSGRPFKSQREEQVTLALVVPTFPFFFFFFFVFSFSPPSPFHAHHLQLPFFLSAPFFFLITTHAPRLDKDWSSALERKRSFLPARSAGSGKKLAKSSTRGSTIADASTCTNATTCHVSSDEGCTSERTRGGRENERKRGEQSGALEKRLSAVKNAGSSSLSFA